MISLNRDLFSDGFRHNIGRIVSGQSGQALSARCDGGGSLPPDPDVGAAALGKTSSSTTIAFWPRSGLTSFTPTDFRLRINAIPNPAYPSIYQFQIKLYANSVAAETFPLVGFMNFDSSQGLYFRSGIQSPKYYLGEVIKPVSFDRHECVFISARELVPFQYYDYIGTSTLVRYSYSNSSDNLALPKVSLTLGIGLFRGWSGMPCLIRGLSRIIAIQL